MAWHCPECCNVFDGPKKPARCSECGERKLLTDDPDPRERDDDDGREYADPHDARSARL